ncbi:hypothetical protein ACFL01_04835 [Planctomycetota bacterium]
MTFDISNTGNCPRYCCLVMAASLIPLSLSNPVVENGERKEGDSAEKATRTRYNRAWKGSLVSLIISKTLLSGM